LQNEVENCKANLQTNDEAMKTIEQALTDNASQAEALRTKRDDLKSKKNALRNWLLENKQDDNAQN
jgi:hypothetical protein